MGIAAGCNIMCNGIIVNNQHPTQSTFRGVRAPGYTSSTRAGIQFMNYAEQIKTTNYYAPSSVGINLQLTVITQQFTYVDSIKGTA